MNTPTIKVILAGKYEHPHVVVQIGNRKTAAHTENYSTRSNAKRAQKTWANVLSNSEFIVLMTDETRKPIR